MNERKIVTLDDLERRGGEQHRKPYFDWIRHVVSLSTASLTALIALQGSYLPSHPRLPVLLAACWVALLTAILLGILALRAEYSVPLDMARKIRNLREAHGDEYATNYMRQNGFETPPWHHRWAVRLMMVAFVFAWSSLCLFAVLNLSL